VLGYRQEGLSNVDSESECTFGSDHIMECADAEVTKPRSFLMQVFTQTF
jgi:hypothetical protein